MTLRSLSPNPQALAATGCCRTLIVYLPELDTKVISHILPYIEFVARWSTYLRLTGISPIKFPLSSTELGVNLDGW